jgi:hypothetical protein
MVSQSHLLDPFIHQRLPGRSFPILFEIGVALATEPAAVVMTEATFQRLMTSSMEFAAVVLQKGTAIPGKSIGGNGPLASFERRREHTKVSSGAISSIIRSPNPASTAASACSTVHQPGHTQ